MLILRHPLEAPAAARGAVLAVGNFDGVHRGHQALLAEAKARARPHGAPAGALVFEPHPQEFFRPEAKRFRLTPFRVKAHLLGRYGVDLLVALTFDAALAATGAEDFVRTYLVRALAARHVVVGGDFRFGRGRAGDVALLQAIGAEAGFGVSSFAPVALGDAAKISSTTIRDLLRAGDPREAARLLGHWWEVEGRVERGDARGRTIGFPTANVSLEGYLEPALGVYAVRVGAGGRIYDGVANFGRRPTFDKKDVLLEVHLLDFEGDLYGKPLSVAFVGFIRAERKFDGLDALRRQIAADADAARRLLAAAPAQP